MENIAIFETRLDFWRFIQDVDCDVRVTKNKQIFSNGEVIAMFRPVKVQCGANACALLKDNAKDG